MDKQQLQALGERWQRLTSALGVGPEEATAVFTELVSAYEEDGRHYHTLNHLAAMFRWLNWLAPQIETSPALELAIWFHDIVYQPQDQDNEAQSAAYAVRICQEWGLKLALTEQVERLILATATHQADEDDSELKLMLDLDLTILGAEPDVYRAYAQAIRQEYHWVPQEVYQTGRQQVLQSFLTRPRLYHTLALFKRLEDRARLNLQTELTELT